MKVESANLAIGLDHNLKDKDCNSPFLLLVVACASFCFRSFVSFLLIISNKNLTMNALRLGASRLAPAALRAANGSLRREVTFSKLYLVEVHCVPREEV